MRISPVKSACRKRSSRLPPILGGLRRNGSNALVRDAESVAGQRKVRRKENENATQNHYCCVYAGTSCRRRIQRTPQLVPKPLHPFFVYMTQISLAGLGEPPNQPQIPFVYASGRAIREDGSSVEVSHSFSPEESGRRDIFGEQKAIFDFSTMRRITVNDTAESTTTTGLVHHDIALSKIVPRAHCGTPAGKMLGYDVEYWEDNTPAVSTKGGTEKPMEDHQKFWGAPALGCYALRKEEKSNWPDGSVFMDSIEQALYVTEGDVRITSKSLRDTKRCLQARSWQKLVANTLIYRWRRQTSSTGLTKTTAVGSGGWSIRRRNIRPNQGGGAALDERLVVVLISEENQRRSKQMRNAWLREC